MKKTMRYIAVAALDAAGHKTLAAGEQIPLIYQNAEGGVQKVVSPKLQETDIAPTLRAINKHKRDSVYSTFLLGKKKRGAPEAPRAPKS